MNNGKAIIIGLVIFVFVAVLVFALRMNGFIGSGKNIANDSNMNNQTNSSLNTENANSYADAIKNVAQDILNTLGAETGANTDSTTTSGSTSGSSSGSGSVKTCRAQCKSDCTASQLVGNSACVSDCVKANCASGGTSSGGIVNPSPIYPGNGGGSGRGGTNRRGNGNGYSVCGENSERDVVCPIGYKGNIVQECINNRWVNQKNTCKLKSDQNAASSDSTNGEFERFCVVTFSNGKVTAYNEGEKWLSEEGVCKECVSGKEEVVDSSKCEGGSYLSEYSSPESTYSAFSSPIPTSPDYSFPSSYSTYSSPIPTSPDYSFPSSYSSGSREANCWEVGCPEGKECDSTSGECK